MHPVNARLVPLVLVLALAATACGNEHELIHSGAQGARDEVPPADPPWPQLHTGGDDDDDDDDDLESPGGDRGEADGDDPDDGRGGDGDDGDSGCTYTQGYWKNHEDAWPVESLRIGGQEYTASELHSLLLTPTVGDASLILGHQLIAAMLNVANGAGTPPEVDTALDSAQQWMAANPDADGRLAYGTPRGGDAHSQATSLADTLADFNEGLIGPGHCR